MSDSKTDYKADSKVPVHSVHPVNTSKEVVNKAEAKVARPFVNTIPDGAMDINEVEPGFSPTKGSPKENDPTQLANPNNPLSAVTVPGNPSNPANPPNTQSDKPASEVRAFNALNPPPPDPEVLKANESRGKEKAEILAKLESILKANNNSESSIPASNEYWALIAKYRALSNP